MTVKIFLVKLEEGQVLLSLRKNRRRGEGFATVSSAIGKSQASNISTATTVGQKTAEGVVALKPNIKYAKGVTTMAGN